jgi:hypothetical protein
MHELLKGILLQLQAILLLSNEPDCLTNAIQGYKHADTSRNNLCNFQFFQLTNIKKLHCRSTHFQTER